MVTTDYMIALIVGTSVVSIMNDVTVGVQKCIDVFDVRVCDAVEGCKLLHVLNALRWLTDKKRKPGIVNMSFTTPDTKAERELIKKVMSFGILFF
jgi:hypothetical protein